MVQRDFGLALVFPSQHWPEFISVKSCPIGSYSWSKGKRQGGYRCDQSLLLFHVQDVNSWTGCQLLFHFSLESHSSMLPLLKNPLQFLLLISSSFALEINSLVTFLISSQLWRGHGSPRSLSSLLPQQPHSLFSPPPAFPRRSSLTISSKVDRWLRSLCSCTFRKKLCMYSAFSFVTFPFLRAHFHYAGFMNMVDDMTVRTS